MKNIIPTFAAATSALLAAENQRRIGFYIWNNSANSMYLSFSQTASSASPTIILATFQTYTSIGPIVWTGPISGIRNAGTGTVTVWELVQ